MPTELRLLTAPGRGAVAVVEARGVEAASMIDRGFLGRQALAATAIDAIRFGRWRPLRDDGSAGEEIVVVRTAADRVELHCHGGHAASAAIVASLCAAGARTAKPSEPREVAPAAEALRLLERAPTERVAGLLLDQADGALERAVEGLLDDLARGATDRVVRGIDELLALERLASRLVTPWRVVVAGPPNVGKSTLVNALVGYERAIVFDQPGTTRDVVTAMTAIGGWPVTLADTAGLREIDDPLESAGVALARRAAAEADVVVLVAEAGAPAEGRERGELLAAVRPHASLIDVASKADLAPPGWRPPAGVVVTSARSAVGVADLLAAIGRATGGAAPPPGAAVPLSPARFERLREAGDALSKADDERAEAALRAVLAPIGL